MPTPLHNPQGITGVMHRTHGIVELSEGQAFQALYKPTGELKRVEIWQSVAEAWHIVKTFHQKSILMTIVNPPIMANKETITALAKEFGNVLKEWLTGEQMLQVIASNREDINASWCASHDFCDANMAMDAAFQKVMQREFVFFNDEQPETEAQNGEDTDLINAAWNLAKENDFYYIA